MLYAIAYSIVAFILVFLCSVFDDNDFFESVCAATMASMLVLLGWVVIFWLPGVIVIGLQSLL